MKVNSYVVSTAEGSILVDGMLTVTDARSVRAHLDALRGPLLGALVTHAHPDHYAGLAHLLAGLEIPIYATPEVRRVIARDDALKDTIVRPMMNDQWPNERIFPNRDAGGEVRLGDTTLRVEAIGPGESPADSLWWLDQRRVFVGDLVYNGMHAYLADGSFRAWLDQLSSLEVRLPDDAVLYVGHGEPRGKAAIAAQRRYIEAFVASVERHLAKSPDARQQAVSAEMQRVLPTSDLAFLMELSVEPIATVLARER